MQKIYLRADFALRAQLCARVQNTTYPMRGEYEDDLTARDWERKIDPLFKEDEETKQERINTREAADSAKVRKSESDTPP